MISNEQCIKWYWTKQTEWSIAMTEKQERDNYNRLRFGIVKSVKTTETFTTQDGKEFETLDAAVMHEYINNLSSALERDDVCTNYTCENEVAEYIIKNFKELFGIPLIGG